MTQTLEPFQMKPAASSSRGTKEFFWILVKRDLKVRYAGATLGALWNIIQPIVMILIYILIFSKVMQIKLGDKSSPAAYATHLCSGMLVWLVFSETLMRSVSILVDNSNFLQKISFPPLILHGSVLFNVILIYSSGLVALWVILLLSGYTPPLASIWTLPIMILAGVAASGLGMILSALHVFFRDVGQVVLIVLQVGFWFNPIVYTRDMLGEKAVFLYFNPMDHFISQAQSLFGSEKADPASWALYVIVIFPIVCLVAGRIIFRRLLPEVRDGL